MDYSRIITELLGIQDVEIEDIKQFKKDLRIEIKLRQRRSECFCAQCGLEFKSVKDWNLKELKAPPLGVYQQVKIKFWQLRGVCEDCNRTSISKVDWIHPKFESMTCGFAEVCGRLMEEITCEAVSRIMYSSSKLMWELDQYRMEVMMRYLTLPKHLKVSYLCADEVHFQTVWIKNRKGLFAKRRQPEFITNLVAPLEGKVLFNAQGRGESSLNQAFAVLSPGQKLAVEQVAVDMHDPFMCAIRSNCPNALIVIDRFHLAQKINQTFDKLRRAEFRIAEQNNKYFEMGILEPKRKFILVSRKKQFLSKVETRLIDDLRRVNKNIHVGMFLVEYFHEALDKKTIKGFRSSLLEWYRVCRTAKLPQFLEFAKLIRKYRRNIEGYINSRLTTAVIEGLNNKIKVLKRMGYGYTNPTSFMRKILQRCGYLNHLSINTDEFYFKWPHPA